jgi:hypothetical protein
MISPWEGARIAELRLSSLFGCIRGVTVQSEYAVTCEAWNAPFELQPSYLGLILPQVLPWKSFTLFPVHFCLFHRLLYLSWACIVDIGVKGFLALTIAPSYHLVRFLVIIFCLYICPGI